MKFKILLVNLLKHKLLPEIIALVVLLVYLSPNIFLPSHAHYLIHDNLDSNVVWYKMLSQSGLLFAPNQAVFYNTLDGIPRGCMPTEIDIYVLLYSFLPALLAYNINIIFMHLIAFIGMYKLLRDYLFKESWRAHKTYIALAFALISFWPSGELSVAGQPIVVWAFLNLLNKDYSLKNWTILMLFPFYSGGFVFSNLFLGIALFIFLLAYSTLTKSWSFKPFMALFIFYTLAVVSDYRLFIMQFI
ncbi:MAG TPA: DUF6044 family protein, partial [Bacteroidia bacterium]|nr:DUF6044 family protein [Bacteroidia bacterium]